MQVCGNRSQLFTAEYLVIDLPHFKLLTLLHLVSFFLYSCPRQGQKECYFADNNNCNGFFHCINGVAYKKKCPDDLRYSTMKAECDWPKAVQCGTRPVTVQPSTGGTSNKPTCTCPFGKAECYSTDMSSCNKFVHCSNGTQYNKQCPGGLRWNTVKNFCDWPTDVNCGSRSVEF